MTNYYKVLNDLKAHFDADKIVNTITEGDIFKVDLGKQTIFPLIHIMVNSANFESNVVRFNVSIIAMDIVDISKSEATDLFIGNDNEQDVLHTQLAVLNRAYEMLRRGDMYSDVSTLILVFDALKKNSRCHAPYRFMKSTTTGSYLHSVLGLKVAVHCNTSAALNISTLLPTASHAELTLNVSITAFVIIL